MVCFPPHLLLPFKRKGSSVCLFYVKVLHGFLLFLLIAGQFSWIGQVITKKDNFSERCWACSGLLRGKWRAEMWPGTGLFCFGLGICIFQTVLTWKAFRIRMIWRMAVLKHGREMSAHSCRWQKHRRCRNIRLFFYRYLWAVVLLLTLLLLLLLLRFSVVDDSWWSLALHWEQLRNGFHISKCLMTGGLRFNWVGRGRVGPQRGKKNIIQ